MSPLAYSFLALAAMLAAADADASNCVTGPFGSTTSSRTIYLDPVSYPPDSSLITIPDACRSQYGTERVGEVVTACNTDWDMPPTLYLVNDPALSPVGILCPNQCPYGGVANIVLYCGES